MQQVEAVKPAGEEFVMQAAHGHWLQPALVAILRNAMVIRLGWTWSSSWRAGTPGWLLQHMHHPCFKACMITHLPILHARLSARGPERNTCSWCLLPALLHLVACIGLSDREVVLTTRIHRRCMVTTLSLQVLPGITTQNFRLSLLKGPGTCMNTWTLNLSHRIEMIVECQLQVRLATQHPAMASV